MLAADDGQAGEVEVEVAVRTAAAVVCAVTILHHGHTQGDGGLGPVEGAGGGQVPVSARKMTLFVVQVLHGVLLSRVAVWF